MLIYVFPPHYQLVCANSYTSSFSLISYERKGVRSREDTLFITIVNEEKAMSLLETQCKWLKTKLKGLEDEA